MKHAQIEKHPGPEGGDHSTGTDQSVHGTGGRTIPDPADTPETTTMLRRRGDHPDDLAGYEGPTLADNGLPPVPEGFDKWMYEGNAEAIEKKVEKLNKRAAKLGLEPFQIIRSNRFLDNIEETWDLERKVDERVLRYEAIALVGQPPRIPGYEFMAAIQHLPVEGSTDKEVGTSGGTINILRTAPDVEEGAIPKQFRDTGPNCEHCDRDIYRKDTYLVRNTETGEIIQCGSSCLKDFTGHKDPTAYASWINEYHAIDSMFDERMERDRPSHSTTTYLAYTAAVIEENGFQSKSKGGTTYAMAAEAMTSPAAAAKIIPDGVQARHWEKAKMAQEWAANMTDDDMGSSGYLWNLHVLAQQSTMADRSQGYLSSIFSAHDRAMGEAVQRQQRAEQAAKSEWVGDVKQRIDFDRLVVEGTHTTEGGMYGPKFGYFMRDASGNRLTWWKSGDPLTVNLPLPEGRVAEILAENQEYLAGVPERTRERGGLGGNPEDWDQTAEFWVEDPDGASRFFIAEKETWDKVEALDKRGLIDLLKESGMTRQVRSLQRTPEAEITTRDRAFAAQTMKAAINSGPIRRHMLTAEAIRAEPRAFGIDTEHYIGAGDVIALRATVKSHDTYRDEKQTLITRGKLLEFLGTELLDDDTIEKAAAALAGALQ